ncbi:MAG: histidine phosphatase family protein [Actinomycetota bacterium]|nr:histidine phosphatase family protein [Actinomycetota bacterium]
MYRLFLIRHGRTRIEGRYKGLLNVPLSPEGGKDALSAAKIIKRVLGDQQLDIIYTSSLIRASKTARIISREFPGAGRQKYCNVEKMDSLRERNFGKWEGLRFDEIANRWPKEFAKWVKDPFKNRPVGGEPTARLKDRVIYALKEINKKTADGQNIALVSHGGALRVMIARLLGIPYKNLFRVDFAPGGVTLIHMHEMGRSPVAAFINLYREVAG